MTEQEWFTCNGPEPMLNFLGGKVSERKMRPFAVACCRADVLFIAGDAAVAAGDASAAAACVPIRENHTSG
jgi:hypothetical protein